MFAVAIAFLACSNQETVTLTVAGATPRQTVARLAELSGLKLSVEDTANRCTLVLRLDKALLDETLERIATVTSSKWVKKDDSLVLTIDKGVEAKERAEEEKLRLASLAKQKAEATKSIQSFESYIEDAWALAMRAGEFMTTYQQSEDGHRQRLEFAAQTPAGRLMRKVLRGIDGEVIAKIPPETVVVYSSSPNRLQKAFPESVASAFDEYPKEAAAWCDAALESLRKVPQKFQEDPRADAAIGQERAALFLMEVSHSARDEVFHVRTACFNGEGLQIAADILTFAYGFGSEAGIPRGLLGAAEIPEDALSLTHMSALLGYGDLPDGSDGSAELAKWRARLVKCDEDEPIGYMAGRMLVKSAERAKRQLVALLPDEVLEWEFSQLESYIPRLSGDQFASVVSQKWKCKVAGDGDWVSVTPVFPVLSRANYLRRKPVSELLGSMAKEGTITFPAILKYAKEQTGMAAFGSSDYWLAEVFTTVWGNVDQAFPLLLYAAAPVKLLAAMTEQEQLAAFSERGVIVDVLGPSTKRVLFDGVYGVYKVGELRHVTRPERPVTSGGIDLPWYVDSWPTQALPDGVPSGSVLKLKYEQSAMVAFKPLPGGKSRLPLAESADRAGMWITGKPFDYDVLVLQVKPMGLLTVTLELGSYRAERSIKFAPAVDDKSWTTLDKVEEPTKGVIEKSIKEWQARRGGGIAGN